MASKLGDETHQNLHTQFPLQSAALFLDVDGTLLPIADRPDDVQVPTELLALLTELQRNLDGALALVSGRSIADLDRLFAPLQLPAAGIHGLERRDAQAAYIGANGAAALDLLRQPLAAFAKTSPGLILEDKGLSLALHFRLASTGEAEIESYLKEVIGKAGGGLELAHGKKVFEVKPEGSDKGTAIGAFMAEPPFHGRRPIFLGDDVTDEDGFAAVNRLGGLSIRIGPKASTHATRTLPDEAGVHAWLRAFSADTTSV